MEHEILNSTELHARYPVFKPNENEIAILEKDAGYLNPEACIAAYLRMASENGAELHFQEVMTSFEEETDSGDGTTTVTVTTNKGVYRTRKLILTVGAWAPGLYGAAVADIVPLRIERRVVYWFEPPTPTAAEDDNNTHDFKVYLSVILSILFS
jgi:sarcosine oxidase